jgi:hypothetical protein
MNELTQEIVLWGGVSGAVVAIVALVVKIVNAVKLAITYFTDLKKKVDELGKHDKQQYMAILRLTVMSDNIPLSERIIAGKEYLDNDGNGDVQKYYDEVLKPPRHYLERGIIMGVNKTPDGRVNVGLGYSDFESVQRVRWAARNRNPAYRNRGNAGQFGCVGVSQIVCPIPQQRWRTDFPSKHQCVYKQ